MTLTAESLPQIQCVGRPVDMSTAGLMRDSTDILDYIPAARQRMQRDGYLYLPGLLDVDLILAARKNMTDQLAREGYLDPGYPTMDAVVAPGKKMGFKPALAKENAPLMKVLYDGAMMRFFNSFLGGAVRHYDYTWVRAVTPGPATPIHADVVYMGRGTHQLYTAWTPIGDAPFETGGLIVLEGSNNHQRLKDTYFQSDVDTYCENRPGQRDGWAKKQGGALKGHADQIRRSLGGGTWRTADYRAGDVVIFSIYTIHGGTDNRSNRFRLSTDTRYQLASEPVDERWIGENPIAHGDAGKRGKIC